MLLYLGSEGCYYGNYVEKYNLNFSLEDLCIMVVFVGFGYGVECICYGECMDGMLWWVFVIFFLGFKV